jgi:hypothetical protein
MRLTLTEDDGTVVRIWDSAEDEEVFHAFADALESIFAATRSLLEMLRGE